MIRTRIYIKSEQNVLKIGFFVKTLIRRCCKAVLEEEQFKKNVEISVFFVDDEQIKSLNNKHRNKNAATDVLSFPLCDEFGFEIDEKGFAIFGDVVISTQTAIRQAKEYGHSLKREIAFLFVHSMLHLMGYDHETSEKDFKLMRFKEEQILKKLNLIRN